MSKAEKIDNKREKIEKCLKNDEKKTNKKELKI